MPADRIRREGVTLPLIPLYVVAEESQANVAGAEAVFFAFWVGLARYSVCRPYATCFAGPNIAPELAGVGIPKCFPVNTLGRFSWVSASSTISPRVKPS